MNGVEQVKRAASTDEPLRLLVFSGAAVFSPEHRIVGMVIQSAEREGYGRMIMAERLAQYSIHRCWNCCTLRWPAVGRGLPRTAAHIRRRAADQSWPEPDRPDPAGGVRSRRRRTETNDRFLAIEYIAERADWPRVDKPRGRSIRSSCSASSGRMPGISGSLNNWLQNYFPSTMPVARHPGHGGGLQHSSRSVRVRTRRCVRRHRQGHRDRPHGSAGRRSL